VAYGPTGVAWLSIPLLVSDVPPRTCTADSPLAEPSNGFTAHCTISVAEDRTGRLYRDIAYPVAARPVIYLLSYITVAVVDNTDCNMAGAGYLRGCPLKLDVLAHSTPFSAFLDSSNASSNIYR